MSLATNYLLSEQPITCSPGYLPFDSRKLGTQPGNKIESFSAEIALGDASKEYRC